VQSERTRAIFDIITSVFFFLFMFVYTYTSWNFYWSSQTMEAGAEILGVMVPGERSLTDWGPAFYPIKFMMPFGGVMLILQGVVWLVRDIYFVATGRHLR
jgi:TRAP-type mannitol/chloroaromatic compound transport system permease small subunit